MTFALWFFGIGAFLQILSIYMGWNKDWYYIDGGPANPEQD